jgi:hypothetical protein
MIFLSIIALVFGFLMVTLGLILQAKLGALLAGLLVGVFGFLGSQKLAHDRRLPQLIVGGIFTVLPVWLVPFYAGSDYQFQNWWPALIIVTVAVAAGIAITARSEQKRT